MDSIRTYSTVEVSEITKAKIPTLLLYARKNNLAKVGKGTHIRYIWLDSDIENFKEYNKNPFKYNHKEVLPTDNYNALYVRLKRAKQRGDTERIEQYTKEMEILLKERAKIRKEQQQKENLKILKEKYPEKLQENK